ncbi:hypothetical protein DFA_03206 [Cavenderia fasciculata]|uniref:IPT/TIG domain-containing protein n=1 Tax=Cavenderia fasciculata TaxID=261658 RepID=F4PGX7_CACFS|nr:uncharacterized protein DFA_03206 [Cavenderia fasciculata]EGG24961.1 hypothetical protein DFA_03206 [Cavenderia fasciculata]|eukprot:XP_004362812.1 hypothetical protein DFA_03206 [Cavenderia fasciculata]
MIKLCNYFSNNLFFFFFCLLGISSINNSTIPTNNSTKPNNTNTTTTPVPTNNSTNTNSTSPTPTPNKNSTTTSNVTIPQEEDKSPKVYSISTTPPEGGVVFIKGNHLTSKTPIYISVAGVMCSTIDTRRQCDDSNIICILGPWNGETPTPPDYPLRMNIFINGQQIPGAHYFQYEAVEEGGILRSLSSKDKILIAVLIPLSLFILFGIVLIAYIKRRVDGVNRMSEVKTSQVQCQLTHELA